MKKDSAQPGSRQLYFAALIGMGFLWTGTAYIVQAYRLLLFIDGDTVNLISCGLYYVCQAMGMALVGLLFLKHEDFAGGRAFPLWTSAIALVCTGISLLSSSLPVMIASGGLLNIMIGILSACYLTRLATNVPQQRRGLVFGGAYAFGTIGTWLVSMPMKGSFLWHNSSFLAVATLGVLSLLLLRQLPPLAKRKGALRSSCASSVRKLIFLAAAVLFFLSMDNTLGFSFPLKSASDSVYIEFTRIFYGIGLVLAGLINDKNRRWGAICCLAALAFPFAGLALGSSMAGETAMWMLAYLFLGFWSAYRILVFADLSAKTGLPVLAVTGLMAGRLGEAAGTLGASLCTGTPLIVLAGIVFALVIASFFPLYQKLYAPPVNPEDAEQQRLEQYVTHFCLSAREQEIFSQIIKGLSNGEIADALYITESTVKFHVGNIFRKTGHSHRRELISDYKLGDRRR